MSYISSIKLSTPPEIYQVLPVGESGLFQWVNITLFVGLIIGALMTWLCVRGKEEEVKINFEKEKRELQKEIADLEILTARLNEEQQELSRVQALSLTNNIDLEQEIESLKATNQKQAALYLKKEAKLSELLEVVKSYSENLDLDTAGIVTANEDLNDSSVKEEEQSASLNS